MARIRSRGYPSTPIDHVIENVRKIHDADRQHPIDRETIARHVGFGGLSGSADRALSALLHYNLMEKVKKGEMRVTDLALRIIHPVDGAERAQALHEAAFAPDLFKELRERYPETPPSRESLASYLSRSGFAAAAIPAATKAYLETCYFLQRERAYDFAVASSEPAPESSITSVEGASLAKTAPVEAHVGDLIQWEIDGALQFENPMRVRLVSPDGQYVAVDGRENGIPMDQVIVEQRAPEGKPQPPMFPVGFGELPRIETPSLAGEAEWMRNKVGAETTVRLLVSGDMGPKEIGRLIRLLEAQKSVLTDEDE